MEINYHALENEVLELLGESKIMVLATASGGRVTARSMSCVLEGLDVYFQTDKTFIKTKQILENPNVALCLGNIQIEGRAEILGHSTDAGNEHFVEKYRKHHEGSYRMYTHLPGEIVIKVRPTLITLYQYIDGKPCRDLLAIQENRAMREYIDICE